MKKWPITATKCAHDVNRAGNAIARHPVTRMTWIQSRYDPARLVHRRDGDMGAGGAGVVVAVGPEGRRGGRT